MRPGGKPRRKGPAPLPEEQLRFLTGCIGELMRQAPLEWMDRFPQHGDTSCLRHSLAVAYTAYRLSRRLCPGCDARSLVRGALLHDFFLYDWHEKGGGHRLHGFTHPGAALRNARRFLVLSRVEQEIIRRHMWPLTLVPPRCREAWLVCLADKLCSLRETARMRPRLPQAVLAALPGMCRRK